MERTVIQIANDTVANDSALIIVLIEAEKHSAEVNTIKPWLKANAGAYSTRDNHITCKAKKDQNYCIYVGLLLVFYFLIQFDPKLEIV